MSQDLVPFDFNALPAPIMATTDLKEITKGIDYLQRLQLVTKGRYVDTGQMSPGHWGVPQPGGEAIVSLGGSIDILPLRVRAKALDMSNNDAVIAVYDRSSTEFKRIVAATEERDSSCMWGPSFLVYERSSAQFFELFLGTVSGRIESDKLVAFLPISPAEAKATGGQARGPLACTATSRYVKKAKFAWHVPVFSRCSEPITNLPPNDVILKEIEKFDKAVSEGTVSVTEEEAAAVKSRKR